MSQILEPEPKLSATEEISGWWYVLACLPVAYFVQLGCLLSLSLEGAAMADAAMGIDVAVLIRCLVGLIWQRHSRDWRLSFAALLLCIPLIWCLYFFWAAFLS